MYLRSPGTPLYQTRYPNYPQSGTAVHPCGTGDPTTPIFYLTPEGTGDPQHAMPLTPQQAHDLTPIPAYASAQGIGPSPFGALPLAPQHQPPRPNPLHASPGLHFSAPHPAPPTRSLAEVHHHSPPPRTATPPDITLLRMQSLSDLKHLFDDGEAQIYLTASRSGQGLGEQQARTLQQLQQTTSGIFQAGQQLQRQLLTQVPSRSTLPAPHQALPPSLDLVTPPPPMPHPTPVVSSTWTRGTERPPLFPADAYHAYLQPPQQVPGAAPPIQVPMNPWETPPYAHTAPAAWGLAGHIQKLMALNQHIPLRALQVLKPLSLCQDRRDMTKALRPDNLQYLSDAMAWLAPFDAQKANELGMHVLVHYLERDKIVPEVLTDALLSALKGLTQWPGDVKDVGHVLSKLRQQPDARFYEAANALVYRLLPRSE